MRILGRRGGARQRQRGTAAPEAGTVKAEEAASPEKDNRAGDPDSPWKPSLADNLNLLRDALGSPSTVDIQRLKVSGRNAALICGRGMVDSQKIAVEVLAPLAEWSRAHPETRPALHDWQQGVLAAPQVSMVHDLQEAADQLFSGSVLLLLDGEPQVLAAPVDGFAKRQPSTPEVEPVIRGSREAMTETLLDNLAMLRRSVPDRRLRVDMKRVGSRTHTRVAVVYLQDVADPDIVGEIHRRIDRVKTDGILESRYLEEHIQDSPWSPFPTLLDTERVDAVAQAVLQGQVVVMLDRTPQALILPVTFFEFFRSMSDYSAPVYFATFLRWIRFLSFFLSFTLPSLYVALVGFHPEVIPTKLALSILSTRQGIPFPAVFEVLILDIMMEVLREATVRMPRNVGQTIGVVGGIILGTAVVQAGIVSNIMVIIVALSAVASFATANFTFSQSVRPLKYFLLLPTMLLGLVGYVGGLALLLLHLCSLESFGVPYTSPLAPYHPRDIKDTLARVPHPLMTYRPTTYHPSDAKRATKPAPPQD